MTGDATPPTQALALISDRFPHALGAVLGGSAAQGHADPVRGRALLEGHRAVAERADPTPLAVAAEGVLGILGGPLREGYTQRWRSRAAPGE